MKISLIIFLMFGLSFLSGCAVQEDVMTARNDMVSTYDSTETSEMMIEQTTQELGDIYVYVCGCVESPGVYPLKMGSRICDALEMAGGVTSEGWPESLNQAEHVEDGQTIYVPRFDEATESIEVEDGFVDINRADKAMLMTLPGIGESKADLIIQYREEHGAFRNIEELMDIPGIKKGVFDKIKDSIKVS